MLYKFILRGTSRGAPQFTHQKKNLRTPIWGTLGGWEFIPVVKSDVREMLHKPLLAPVICVCDGEWECPGFGKKLIE